MIELFEYLEKLKEKSIYTVITTSRTWKGVFNIRLFYFNIDGEKCELSKVFDNNDSEYILQIIKDMENELLRGETRR